MSFFLVSCATNFDQRPVFADQIGAACAIPQTSTEASALPARGTTGRVLAKRDVCLIFASAERGRAQAFPLSVFLGANYPI